MKSLFNSLWLLATRIFMIFVASMAFEIALRKYHGPNALFSLVAMIMIVLLVSRMTRPRSGERRIKYDPQNYPQDGHDFEVWVARRLRDFGLKAEVTKGSGDQGIDVIARIGRTRVGIQCKRYSGSVGNRAVQEAFSGGAFYKLDKVAVVSTGKYTASARVLAGELGVLLLDTSDLPKIQQHIASGHVRK